MWHATDTLSQFWHEPVTKDPPTVTTIHHKFTFRSKTAKITWIYRFYNEKVDLLLTSDRSNAIGIGQIILELVILELFTHYKCRKPLELT